MTPSDSRQERILKTATAGHDATDRAEHELDQRPNRREVTKIAVVVALVVAVLGSALSITVAVLALGSAARIGAEQQVQKRDFANNQKLADQAFDAATQANKALADRGQAQVPIPAPDGNDPSDTLVAAATARVLAQLPRDGLTAKQLGEGIASYLAANPVTPEGPSAGQISQALAGYLATNPPPSGEPGQPGETGTPGADGKDGKDGATPSEADIQKAFTDYLANNPGFLAAQLCFGKDFSEAKDLTAADGSLLTLYGCVTSSKAPQPPTTTTTRGSVGFPFGR